MCSNELMEKRHTFVNTCLQGTRVLPWSYEHFVGAYGVVGFSGVKDARKSVVAADALRRLVLRRLGHHLHANTGRNLDKNWTNTGRMQCKYWTDTEHWRADT